VENVQRVLPRFDIGGQYSFNLAVALVEDQGGATTDAGEQ
jgi:hypothetical protein